MPRQLNITDYLADPYPHYHRLRSADPVHWSSSQKLWMLTRYADVVAALRHPGLSSRRPRPDCDHLQQEARTIATSFYNTLSTWLLRSDPPHHSRVRKLATPAFDRGFIQRMRNGVRQAADRLLDAVEPSGQMEVIADFAAPLALSAIADQIGVPRQDQTRFQQWSADLGAAAESAPQGVLLARGHRSLCAVEGYFRDLLHRRRLQPQDDLPSRWLRAEANQDRLAEEEIIGLSTLLLLAGQDTATHLLANGVLALLQNRDQWEKLRAEPSLIEGAVEEFLRYDTPLQGVLRVAVEDLELGGKRISQGQTVLVWLGAANRDPAQFPEPDRLDVGRQANHHVGFGHGIHYCLGALLGRLITATAMRALLERAPRFRLAIGVAQWQGNFLFRCQRLLRTLF